MDIHYNGMRLSVNRAALRGAFAVARPVVAGAVDPGGNAVPSSWYARSAYRYSAETTVYVARESVGRGLGRRLYEALIERLREQGIHCAIGGIALPNEPSVRLHEKLGFRRAGVLCDVGYKLGRWIDVEYWQLML